VTDILSEQMRIRKQPTSTSAEVLTVIWSSVGRESYIHICINMYVYICIYVSVEEMEVNLEQLLDEVQKRRI